MSPTMDNISRSAYLSELIGAYIDARYYQYAIALTQKSVESREKTLSITSQQLALGSSTELELEQVKALLYAAKADLPDLQANYLSEIYVMATLLNQTSTDILRTMDVEGSGKLLGLNLDVDSTTGIPADLIRNRPDVRSAEQDLIAATATVGVKTADMLPSITLSGSLSTSGSTSWSFGPSINLPLFNQNALASQRDAALSQARQAELTWRQTILSAVEDVQKANSTWLRDNEKVSYLQQSMQAYEQALELSLTSYQAGVMNLLDLLDTDRSLASARISFADGLRNKSINWASLQIALGAGSNVGN